MSLIRSYPLPADDEERFDVVGLCLVLNFAGDLNDRGAMLVRAAELLVPRGLLYLVLPASCVTNSRYLDHDHLRRILASVGFDDVVRQRDTAKLTFWLVRRSETLPNRAAIPVWRKSEVRRGVGSFNNVRWSRLCFADHASSVYASIRRRCATSTPRVRFRRECVDMCACHLPGRTELRLAEMLVRLLAHTFAAQLAKRFKCSCLRTPREQALVECVSASRCCYCAFDATH